MNALLHTYGCPPEFAPFGLVRRIRHCPITEVNFRHRIFDMIGL